MWKKNFLFRAHEATPLKESENELFHDSEPALDSAGLQMEKFLSVWVQGEGKTTVPPSTPISTYGRRRWIFGRRQVSCSPCRDGRIRSNRC